MFFIGVNSIKGAQNVKSDEHFLFTRPMLVKFSDKILTIFTSSIALGCDESVQTKRTNTIETTTALSQKYLIICYIEYLLLTLRKQLTSNIYLIITQRYKVILSEISHSNCLIFLCIQTKWYNLLRQT